MAPPKSGGMQALARRVFPCPQQRGIPPVGGIRYYGYYSNVARGKRKKQDQDELIPHILEPDGSSREFRKSWARLIQKIYEVDSLMCPKCLKAMKIISFIEDEEIIEKILKHLGLWEKKARPPPKAAGPSKIPEFSIDYSTSQLPVSDNLPRASRSNGKVTPKAGKPPDTRGQHKAIYRTRGAGRGKSRCYIREPLTAQWLWVAVWPSFPKGPGA